MLYLTILNYCLDFSYCIISIYFFLLNILGCALIYVSSKDPLFVLLHFLGIFILSIYTLFFLNIEFLGFVFLLVYLGAIMIFFMFVINFINLRYKISVFTYVERGKLLVWEIFNSFILIKIPNLFNFLVRSKEMFLKIAVFGWVIFCWQKLFNFKKLDFKHIESIFNGMFTENDLGLINMPLKEQEVNNSCNSNMILYSINESPKFPNPWWLIFCWIICIFLVCLYYFMVTNYKLNRWFLKKFSYFPKIFFDVTPVFTYNILNIFWLTFLFFNSYIFFTTIPLMHWFTVSLINFIFFFYLFVYVLILSFKNPQVVILQKFKFGKNSTFSLSIKLVLFLLLTFISSLGISLLIWCGLFFVKFLGVACFIPFVVSLSYIKSIYISWLVITFCFFLFFFTFFIFARLQVIILFLWLNLYLTIIFSDKKI